MENMHFTFSDMIAGRVTRFEWEKRNYFSMRTADGREFEVQIGDNCYAELTRNLGHAFADCTAQLTDMLEPGRYLFAYGVFYNNGGRWSFEAKHIVFSGRTEDDYVFEKQDWWIDQISTLSRFYLKAQFGEGPIDYRNYRTQIALTGERTGDYRQECDTISRLVYGFASAYNLTGDERCLEAAEAGVRYLRDHFRCIDRSDKTAYWYHAIDVKGGKERKVFASESGDDYDAIPAYEQIYALAGPTQTFRITADPEIGSDIQLTINMFQKYFLDRKLGGYWSHVDPITLDGRAESLGRNRARKNWNSIGDHAPAYLINAVIATGNPEWLEMLEYCADTITAHFPDYENSPFVNEKFHEDWSHDTTWGWQQNRAVVGHNLKIAWNLMRINSAVTKGEYVKLAERIAGTIPKCGRDLQRGGWYDVVNRVRAEGEDYHRYAWHDRKAWWQQEQGILAYLILAGALENPEYLELARESSAFYNAWFLDHDSGGVYFNVLANGIPFLLGTERNKGSHSMSGYHSFELAFLGATYSNLLVTKQPVDYYFKPMPGVARALNVAPDMLPRGSVRIERVWIDDKEYTAFDAEGLTVTLPESRERLRVKVRIVPSTGVSHFAMAWNGDTLVLSGDLDARAVHEFTAQLSAAVAKCPDSLTIDASALSTLSKPAARALLFEKQKMSLGAELTIVGANAAVRELLDDDEFSEEITLK